MTNPHKHYDVFTVVNTRNANRMTAMGVLLYPKGFGEDQYEVSTDVLGPAHDVPDFVRYAWFAIGSEPGEAEKGASTVGVAVFCKESLSEEGVPDLSHVAEQPVGDPEVRYELSDRQLRQIKTKVEESMREELGLDREDLIKANESLITKQRTEG